MISDLHVEYRPIDQLIPYINNPRTHSANLNFAACSSEKYDPDHDGSKRDNIPFICCDGIVAALSGERYSTDMEISEAYVDVAVMRWQDETGRKAVLDGEERTFAEVQENRVAESDLTTIPDFAPVF